MAAMSDRTIVVARRFRGPDAAPATGNGGYFCGLVAGAAPQATTIEIRASAGVPLDRPLAVRVDAGTVEVLDDGALVARSSPARLAVHPPVPPPLEVALEASRRFEADLDDGSVRHTFPGCFVCGHRRAPGDGMRLFAGPLPGDGPERGQVRVAGWRPHRAFLDEARCLRPEFVWAALDCPGGWALPGPINTGTLQVEVREPVGGQRPLIVMGWRAPAPSPHAGSRRRYVGTAMFDADGRLLALGAAIWVTPGSLAAAR
jgi:hypothetical protein